jgi:hypothetical protein
MNADRATDDMQVNQTKSFGIARNGVDIAASQAVAASSRRPVSARIVATTHA